VLVDVIDQQLAAIRHLTFLDKLALWASWGAAAGIFLTLGWMALAPNDPLGAVSLLVHEGSLGMWMQAAGLAAVASAIATVLVGRVLPYAGPFAAAFGLAIVSIRGGTSESLIIAARTAGSGSGALAARMAMESAGWMGVMLLAFAVARAIARWCFPAGHRVSSVVPDAAPKFPAPAFSIFAFAAGLLAFNILGAGMATREIRHTQGCFVVGASVWLGCYVAFRIVPTLAFRWYAAAAGLLVLAGYGWASFLRDSDQLPLSLPPSNFLRILPIQFVTVGCAAAIAAYWSHLRYGMVGPASDRECGIATEEPG
jgi:hypothetical protein